MHLDRQIGLFDATMVVMGGIIGAGIFMNPYVVARQVHSPLLILGAWLAGGLIALAGAFIYAELATRLPLVGGQYAYLREAYHPLVGFLYGWVLLLVIQTGGMAAVALTFARYFLELTGLPVRDGWIAVLALALLTLVNVLGVRPGARVQSALTVLKIAAIATLLLAGVAVLRMPHVIGVGSNTTPPRDTMSSFLAAMLPVLFAYGGWQTANFIAGELRHPRRDLPRALLLGVTGVVALYLIVNLVCVWVLGAPGLAATTTPASAVMRLAFGRRGGAIIAAGIAISALGFLAQSILTAPRVYFAMADDGLFFRSVAHLNRRQAPDVAITLQSVWTVAIAITGTYEHILNVIAMDFLFFGLTATTVFVFRHRERTAGVSAPTQAGGHAAFRIPGHPITTVLFIAAAWLVVANTLYRYPADSLLGAAILAAGVPVYFLWRKRRAATVAGE